jgi:hypothetical protein
MGENLCQLFIQWGLMSRIYKKIHHIKQQMNYPTYKWTIEQSRYFAEEVQVANKCMNIRSVFLVAREMQIKTALGFHLISVEKGYHEERKKL